LTGSRSAVHGSRLVHPGVFASLFIASSPLRRFLGYVRPHLLLLAGATLLGVVKFGMPVVWSVAAGMIVDGVLQSGSMTLEDKQHSIHWICSGLAAGFMLCGIGVFFRHYLASKAQYLGILGLRVALFQHMQRLSLSFYSRERTGSLLSRLFSDIELARNFIGSACTNIWMDAVTAVLIGGIMLYQDRQLALLVFALIPFQFFCFRYFNPRIKESSLQMQQRLAEMSGHVHEKLTGMAIVQAFNGERKEQRRFLSGNLELYHEQISNARFSAFFHAIFHSFSVIAPLLVLWVGASRVLHTVHLDSAGGMTTRQAGLSPGELTSFLLLIPQFQTPLTRFADLNVVVQNSLAAMERIFEIFDVVPDIVDRPGAGDIQSVRGQIEFRDVWFEYSPGSPILKDVNLIIEPHSTVALVGPSGAGKSSLVSLIPRFFDISQGQIFLDGNDIRDIRVKSLRDQIGLIPQEVILFSGTIEENILYGNPSATQEQVRQAAQAANAHDFIIALPDGYETLVGEKGTGLSGGQKQRIAIARAFLKDPPILILDEATSALDSESENAISKALSQLLIGRTTLIIAHRLSTVMNADRIIVLEEGHIRETGTHGSLLEQDGLYRRLCEEQFKVLFAFDRHSESSAQIA